MREVACADPHIQCPVYTKTGMSRPVLEEFFSRKIKESPFSRSMQKHIHMYMYCIVTFIWCVCCTVVVLTCFVIWSVCVCMFMCGFCYMWVCVCVGFWLFGVPSVCN
jgi:hypothetical protein